MAAAGITTYTGKQDLKKNTKIASEATIPGYVSGILNMIGKGVLQ